MNKDQITRLAKEAGIRDCTCDGDFGCIERFAALVAAHEREVEKQEPVGHADLGINNIYLFNDQEQRVVPKGRQPLYTHPPKREWGWLTDEEIYEAFDTIIEEPKQAIQFCYNIQAKLKEKNT